MSKGNNGVPIEKASGTSDKVNKKLSSENIDELIGKANTLNELLAIADRRYIDRIQALKIVSILAEWSAAGKVKPTDFENNTRFIRVCSLLTANADNKQKSTKAKDLVQSKEMEMILNVAGEDESAKLIQNLHLPQMVKVLTALAQKRTRSLPLLRNLSYSISNSMAKLNLKECSDVFFAMTVLRYHDGMLMSRISMDIIANLESSDNSKAAPVGSIVTSLGYLKFKNTGTLCHSLCNEMFPFQFMKSTFFQFRVAQRVDQVDT